ncbi:MAG: FtsX-like permease family protein [Bacteroidetes bacterium]|nr:FtsX-like permease family protein [Bacteroidota bacterium]
MNALASEYIPANNKTETHLMLESISSIHLHSQLQDQPKSTGSATTVYFLVLVGIVVLIMAWINYFNLTASRSIHRAKEIGIRKVTGASRASIAWQFLTESLVMHTISFMLAIIFFNLITPIFYRWIGLPHIASFSLLGLITRAWIVGIIGLFLVGLFASGFFPVRYFAAVNPSKVLKGKWQAPRTKFPVRKVMLTFQFSCTVILAIVVLIFEQQFSFIKEQALGIDIKRSIVLTAPANVDSTYLQKLSSFKNQLKTKTVIHSVATSTDVPGNALGSGWGGNIMRSADETGFGFGINVIDPDFIESYHLKLLAGRNFTTGDFPGTHFGDKLEPVIINRKGSEVLGFKSVEESIGQYIYWGLRKEASKCLVVGVIEEFHTESLKKSIQPMLYVANMGPSMTLKLTEGADKNLPAALAQIKDAWQQFFPSNAFDYFILEDRFNQQYEDDERVARLFNLFCLLAFSIAGVGLFGLSMYSLATRLKEISIRKVLGAPLTHLVLKLTSEYLLLIILASVIALPLTYFGIKEWLSGFAVKIELSVWHFIVPMIAVVIFALATVMIQTLKAAARNPVESLKNE